MDTGEILKIFVLIIICWTHNISFSREYIYTGWNDNIFVLKKTTLQLYLKTFIEKINSANLIMY